MAEFDDPFKPSDATVIRPRPGAGRRGPSDPGRPPLQPPPAHVEAVPAATLQSLGIGLNPLVQAASPLLMLAGQLRGTLAGPDIATLRRHALDEIRRFEERAHAGGSPNEVVMAARYALCAGLDEAVLSTPWGAQSEWGQQTLLVALHREAWGGEKFFDMLDRISQDPARHIDLMELQYLCVALGFMGKYQVAAQGHARLAEVQQNLYRKIRQHRGIPKAELSLRWQGVEDRRSRLIRYVPWWVVGAAALAVLAITYTAYSVRLTSAASPVHVALAKLGREAPASVSTVPVQGPTLRSILAADPVLAALDPGAFTVAEDGAQTRITMTDLFASGSADVNPAHRETLRRITAALNQVPGRVWIVGHTDDQPVRLLRFRDNFQLSRERALAVSKVLREGIDSPGRLEHAGAGSTEPRHLPPSEPRNRALNRRVEIVHVRGS
jgi:type VI secretion system protein ImpK